VNTPSGRPVSGHTAASSDRDLGDGGVEQPLGTGSVPISNS
jgi:hypothetical protein